MVSTKWYEMEAHDRFADMFRTRLPKLKYDEMVISVFVMGLFLFLLKSLINEIYPSIFVILIMFPLGYLFFNFLIQLIKTHSHLISNRALEGLILSILIFTVLISMLGVFL